MVEAFVRTETNRYVRTLVVEFQDGGTAKFWGDPVKAVVSLLLFRGSVVKSWVFGKGLEVELDEETCRAIRALSNARLTWKQAADRGFLQNGPQHILRTLALDMILKGERT